MASTTFEPYSPRPEDTAWAQNCVRILNDGGVIGTSIGAYKIDKKARTVTLLGGLPDDAPEDARETHWKHLFVWEAIGWTVLPELRNVTSVKTDRLSVTVRPAPSPVKWNSLNELSNGQRDLRSLIRGFLIHATPAELERELELSLERNDQFRAACVRELIQEGGR